MFRIMLLLCYSMIDTNTIPFYFSTVSDWKSRATHSAVRTYRIISLVSLLILRVLSYGRTFASTSLKYQLVQAVIPPQRDAFVDSKGSGNLLRINCVLPTSLHTQHDASAEKDPPVGLSSIHSPTLGRV